MIQNEKGGRWLGSKIYFDSEANAKLPLGVGWDIGQARALPWAELGREGTAGYRVMAVLISLGFQKAERCCSLVQVGWPDRRPGHTNVCKGHDSPE